ncbi:hypothetical protein DVH05_001332 [Phytophthora capsici]|nr:hypothetical protein DVH05_001332 [Phytophthora capsici]
MMNFYVVTGGRCSGIFTSRDLVLDATVGYPGARYRKFSTLKEAEEAMKEHSGETKTPLKWTGAAYAVAVGRRMGIFTHQEALNQTRYYSANSMKRFDSYEEAVEFLDKHNWRKMLNSPFEDEKHLQSQTSWATDSNASTDTNSSTSDNDGEFDSTANNNSDEKSMLVTTFPKRKRKDNEDVGGQRPTQRQKVGNSTPEAFYAFCDGHSVVNDTGNDDILALCVFPNHSQWNVGRLLTSENSTMLQAGLLAVKEALKRANTEDPECKADLTIFTDTFYSDLDEFIKNGKEGGDEGFLLDILTEKRGRKLNICLLHQGFELRTGPRKPFNA